MKAGSKFCSLGSALICATFVLALGVRVASADCGYEDEKFANAGSFTASNGGSLGLKFSSSATTYFLLRRDRCTRFSSKNTRLRFVLNHLDLANTPEKAFVTAHVALFNPRDRTNLVYTFRNSKSKQNGWVDDTAKNGDYWKLYDNGTPAIHPQFDSHLSLNQNEFNQIYRSGNRTWMDRLAPDGEETWDSRGGFAQRHDLIAAAQAGAGGLKVQNYLINFTTGDSDNDEPLKYAPHFIVDAGGADCIFVRISGSSNVRLRVAGEYSVALNNRTGCDAVIQNLRGISFFEALFGVRF